jgi:hypothetical protein
MAMTREEIDLREQIGNEIEAYIRTISDDDERVSGLWKAIGVVRSAIWHNPQCPCSRCAGAKPNLINYVCAECSRENLLPEEIVYGHDCEVSA